jgi:hypothetical protein
MTIRTVLLKITKPNGEQIDITARSLSGRLTRPEDFPDIVARLLLEEEVSIDLRDVGPATLTFADAEPVQTSLALPSFRPPHHEYEATVSMRFELTARIECTASSRAEALYLIGQVLRHERKSPPGFNVVLSDEDLEDFTSNLDYAASGRPHLLGVHDHTVTDIRERLLITRQDTSS